MDSYDLRRFPGNCGGRRRLPREASPGHGTACIVRAVRCRVVSPLVVVAMGCAAPRGPTAPSHASTALTAETSRPTRVDAVPILPLRLVYCARNEVTPGAARDEAIAVIRERVARYGRDPAAFDRGAVPDEIVIELPSASATGQAPGPKQTLVDVLKGPEPPFPCRSVRRDAP